MKSYKKYKPLTIAEPKVVCLFAIFAIFLSFLSNSGLFETLILFEINISLYIL